jgi:NAD(P)-dependent dehydrogenase (short-subunit alcohol dehydrogenase family)
MAFPDRIDRSYDGVQKYHRPIDIIFANAGVAKLAPFGTVDEQFFDLHFNPNVKGLFGAERTAVAEGWRGDRPPSSWMNGRLREPLSGVILPP